MNYKKMLEDINKLVDNDFTVDLELKKTYTQKEARQMAKIIADVYWISHLTHCKFCRNKYLLKTQ